MTGNTGRTISLAIKYVKDPEDHRTLSYIRDAVSNVINKDKAFSTGAIKVLPSELLINEEGIMVDRLDANKVGDTISMDRIAHFLLRGKKLPASVDKPKPKAKKFGLRKKRNTM